MAELTSLSDLDVESARLILNLLSPKDLCCVASTCRYFYRAIFDGPFAERLWKSHCTDLLGEGVVALHNAAILPGYKAGPIFWRDLWLAGKGLDSVRWWRSGANELKASVDRVDSAKEAAVSEEAIQQANAIAADNADGLGEDRRKAVLAEAEAASAGRSTLKAKLARSGHAAYVVGEKVVITGGILRDGSLIVDVVIVDLATMSVIRPDCEGEAPSTRFRHTMAPISPSLGTPLHDMVSEGLGPKESISSGQLLLIFGGYNTIGEEFGANSTFVLWAATDGSKYIWREITTHGTPPTPRFHHSCETFDGGRKAIIFGGEGYMLDDTGDGPSPSVYILDVDTLVWTRNVTHAPEDEHNPGARSLHVTTIRRSPVTGHEELVVVGGYYTSMLAEMKPYTLDLETLVWQCWEGTAHDVPEPPELPEPRQRMAAMRISHDWFLISGGSPASGSFLDDLQRLHVPSLTWGRAPEVFGRPSRALRRIAGHTLAGLLAFGGCIPTIMGIMPVEKLDLLLLGNKGTAGLLPARAQAQEATAFAAAPVLPGPCAANAPLSDGSLGFQRGSAVMLAARAERKQQALLRIQTKQATPTDTVAESSSGQKEPAQEQQATSDPDSPMLDPNKKQGPVDLETAAHDGVFNQFVADQLLSKGQRINIGSPDTYFRPAYATAAGVKSAPDADDPSQFAKGRLQVINTSLLGDAQHIEQMNRQFHPSRQGQPVPPPASGSGLDAGPSGSLSVAPDPANRPIIPAHTPSAAELAAQLSSMGMLGMQKPTASLPPTGASTRRKAVATGPDVTVQYTAEEKGKAKALAQETPPHQPIGDVQEARELEESLLLSRLQATVSSTCKVLATNDPEMPGGPPQTAQMQTFMYLGGPPAQSEAPGEAPSAQVGPSLLPTQAHDSAGSSSCQPGMKPLEYPVSAAIPGIHPQDYMIASQGPLDAHRVFLVSSVRNDEIASLGPNPFASHRSRPWGGDPAMNPYLIPPSASVVPHLNEPLQLPPTSTGSSGSHGESTYRGDSDALLHSAESSDAWAVVHGAGSQQLPLADQSGGVGWAVPTAQGQSHLMFSDSMRLPPAAQRIVQGPWPRIPSATSLSSQSFASATSAELQDVDLQEQDPDLFGTPAKVYAWAEEDRHPGLVMPPGQAPALLKQILDTSSILPQDEPRASQGTGAYAASAPAGKPCQKRQPRCKDHQPAPDPFRYSSESLEDPPQTMQLWRDVRTGQLYRLLPSSPSQKRPKPAQLSSQQKLIRQSRLSRRRVELESVHSSDDKLAWSHDPARSLCCIQ